VADLTRYDRDAGTVIDLEEARIARLPQSRYGGAHVEGGRVVVDCVAELTPDAAEAFARTLTMLAQQAREGRDA
jgi:hypothetical protein